MIKGKLLAPLLMLGLALPVYSEDYRPIGYVASEGSLGGPEFDSKDQLIELAGILPGYYCAFTGKSWMNGGQKMCEYRCTQGRRWVIWNLNVHSNENCFTYEG